MSHLVVRGKPTAAQLYLDQVLDAVLTARGLTPNPTTRASVTATEILLHCFKERPKELFMINAATGAEITNEQHLKKTISFSRALTAKGAKGKHAMLLMRNHEDTVATYFATLFTGMIPFMIDPNSTVYEITHFLELVEPTIVFYDQEFDDSLKEALKACKNLKTEMLMVNGPGVLQQFTEGFSDDIDSFQVAPAAMDDALLMVPTSGSTGIPKAAILTHWGIFSHLPCLWAYHSKFPTPTARMMVLTTIQWVTFTLSVTTSIVYHIPIVITPKKVTPEHVIEIVEKYRELVHETQSAPASDTEATETRSGAQPVTASTSETLPATDSTLNASSSVVPPSNSKVKRPGKRNADTPNDNLTTDVLRSVQNHFKKPVHNNDRFDIFGTNVAAKLRDLTKQQRILAEKLINETLFEAEMENLTTSFRIMDPANVRFNYNSPSPSTIIHTPSPRHITYTPSPVHYQHFDTNSNSQDSQPMLINTHISIPDSAATYVSNFDINTN